MDLDMPIAQPIETVADEAAEFAAALVEAQQPLLRLARRLVFDREEARDLVQATLADAIERRHQLRDRKAAPLWLRRILVSRAMSYLRRRRLKQRIGELLGLGAVEPSDTAPPADEALASARRLASLERALRHLPPQQATAFTLRYLEGLDLDEVTAAMGVGRGTVRTHLYRALQALRAELGDAGGGR